MNKLRREELYDVTSIVEDAISRLEEIISDEQDSFDNLPEGLQASRTGDSMLQAIDDMTVWIDKLAAVGDEINKYASNKKK